MDRPEDAERVTREKAKELIEDADRGVLIIGSLHEKPLLGKRDDEYDPEFDHEIRTVEFGEWMQGEPGPSGEGEPR